MAPNEKQAKTGEAQQAKRPRGSGRRLGGESMYYRFTGLLWAPLMDLCRLKDYPQTMNIYQ